MTLDQPGRGEGLRVERRLRRRLDVPLRHRPALHHIANGMFGMVIVEPEEGLPPVDHEFAIVQSEWYLGPQGEPRPAKAAAAAPAPDFVVFNGVANQYVDNPIEVATGKRPGLRPQRRPEHRQLVPRRGHDLQHGHQGRRPAASRATTVAAARRPSTSSRHRARSSSSTTPEDGLYPMVTHAFNFVGRGALGLFQAGDGDPAN